jgi:acyl dehydratase
VPRVHWEDFALGQVTESGPRLVTREEIIAFAAEFDPQPMHLDEEAASATMLGGLAASGWHTCCILMRMISDSLLVGTSFMGAPGIEEVKWLAPLRPGARVKVRATVLEARPSRSRPDMGFVKFAYELIDETGTAVLNLTVIPMFGRRTAGEARPPAALQAQDRP